MKKCLCIGLVCVFILIGLFLLWNLAFGNKPTVNPVTIQQDWVNPANSKQNHATIQMTSANGKLYFYYPADSRLFWDPNVLADYLCTFEGGTIRRLLQMNSSEYMIFYNGFVYYHVLADSDLSTIRCYDIAKETDSEIFTTAWEIGRTMHSNQFYLSADGVLYIPANSDKTSFVSVAGSNVVEESAQQESYRFGNWTYVIDRSGHGRAKVYAYTDQSLSEDFSDYFEYGVSEVFSCDSGLVIYEQNEGYHLYYLHGETGKITELFTAECARSVSSINVYQNNVYLSFLRYESYDILNVRRYEDDSLEGTWCFNLDTGTYEKISESVYNGMFIFDDTGIFVCDEARNIYKLDFDGNVIMTLLTH